MNLSYGLYMAETNGYLNTRKSKLQKIIKVIKSYPNNTISDKTFYTICEECGIAPNSITEAEIACIQNAIKD